MRQFPWENDEKRRSARSLHAPDRHNVRPLAPPLIRYIVSRFLSGDDLDGREIYSSLLQAILRYERVAN